jgi:Tol biopolymer transport system component
MRVSWSADGRTLALSRIYYGPGSLQLLFVDVATMTIRAHGTIDGSVWSASWSPDGKNMAIGSNRRVYLADAAGGELDVLLGLPVWDLAWAPTGQKIALIGMQCDLDCWGADIELLDVKTKEVSVLQRNGDAMLDGLTWSPDGSRLAYSAWDVVSGMSSIRIMNVTTGESGVALTNASDPSWRR